MDFKDWVHSSWSSTELGFAVAASVSRDVRKSRSFLALCQTRFFFFPFLSPCSFYRLLVFFNLITTTSTNKCDVTTWEKQEEKRQSRSQWKHTLVILMLGMIEGACKLGEGSWLWLPLVMADMMTGSPPCCCSLSLAMAVCWWGRWDARCVQISHYWCRKELVKREGKPPEGDDHIPSQPTLPYSSPAVSWNSLRRDGFFGQPQGCVFLPRPRKRMPCLECRIIRRGRTVHLSQNCDGEQDTTAAAAAIDRVE